jgi:Flp pilus assembly protein TadG
MRRLRNQRGAALLETAITIPLVLLISVAIFDFGRAYQTGHASPSWPTPPTHR